MTGLLREWWERTVGFLRRPSGDRGLDGELTTHLEMAVEDYVRAGMSADEAGRLAAMKFGSRFSAKEQAHDQRGLPWLDSFVADLRYAFRIMRKNPGSTAVVVLSLAIGMGATTAAFSVLYAALRNPYPYRGVDRMVRLSLTGPTIRGDVFLHLTGPQVRELQQLPLVESVLATNMDTLILTGQDAPEEVHAVEFMSNGFADLGVPPALGRGLLPSDEIGSPPAAVLSYKFWQQQFASNPDVLGKTL